MSAIFDHDLDAIVEPWQPQVGQRVRIRLSGECVLDGKGGERHESQEDGRPGVVTTLTCAGTESWAWLFRQGHRYLVSYDELFLAGDSEVVTGALYAACELEPLEDQHER